jgi:biotin carboxyl carrier protein
MSKTYIATIDGRNLTIPEEQARKLEIRRAGRGNGRGLQRRGAILDVIRGGKTYRVCVSRLPDGETEIWVSRYRMVVSVQDEREARMGKYVRAAAGTASVLRVKAPMPGLIKEIMVKEGEDVTRGQRLLTLEAMKMENEITAPGNGRIGKFDLKPGTSVEKDQILIQLLKNDH